MLHQLTTMIFTSKMQDSIENDYPEGNLLKPQIIGKAFYLYFHPIVSNKIDINLVITV